MPSAERISLRDRFAMTFIAEVCRLHREPEHWQVIARSCYAAADAMMAERRGGRKLTRGGK